jgi:hypothetical protein
MITVRLWKGLLVAIIGLGLAGCTNSAAPSPPAGGSRTATGLAGPTAAQVSPLPSGAVAQARAAATQFDSAYFASRYATSWSLLAPDVRRQVPENVWIKVHEGCPAATSGVSRTIKSVTVFGATAIVTETVLRATSKRNTVAYVFYYTAGHWGYAPVNPGIYHGRSVAADIAAAKAAGLCAGWQSF